VSAAAQRKSDNGPLRFLPVRTIWTLALNAQLAVPAAYDAERAFFAIAGERLVAYDVASGTQQWIVDARPRLRPAIGDGLLFSAEPDALVARRISDGSVDWQKALADAIATPPVWDNGWLVVATDGGSILTFRAKDGELIWRKEVGSRAHAVPALAADRVYVPTEDGRLVALQVEDGATVWERRLGGAVGEILALEDRVYAGTKDQFLYCVLAKDGHVDWRWRTGGPVVGAPVADERNIYFAAMDNVLRALSRTSGAQRWIRPLPLRPAWPPVMAGQTLIVSGQASNLRFYDTKDGKPAGDLSNDAEVADAPRVFAGADPELPHVLVITRDIAKGAAARLVAHSFDPESSILSSPLPNVISMEPKSTDKP
jgi:outer membrane protein assembly factor BamB